MKLEERLMKYGAASYAKMRGFRGKKALKEIARLKKLIPTAPIELEPKAPNISRSQRSYWQDVKSLAKARDINIKSSRRLLKSLKTAKNVQVRVIKQGEGWQLIMNGLYEHREKDGEPLPKPYTREEQEGNSYVHYDDEFEECYEEAFEECKAEAIVALGGTGWVLVKVLKETWIKFYGRKENLTKYEQLEVKEHEETQITKSKEGKARRKARKVVKK